MRTRLVIGCWLACIASAALPASSRAAESGTAGPEPWLAERLARFQDLKFGFMMHWGAYSQWGCIESWPLVEEDKWARPEDLRPWVERGKDLARFQRDYRALPKTFNPVKFEPRTWAELAKAAGMKYVVFTTKHHDGFCMFDTQLTDYRVTSPEVPFHNDARSNVVREVFAAFRREQFVIGAYFSKADWHSPDYWEPGAPARTRNPNYDTLAQPEKWRRFVDFTHGQIEELMTGYGRVDILWLDAGQVRPPAQDLQMDQLAAMARRHQPQLLVVDRTVGGRYENYRTPEQEVPEKPLPYAWESCLTMGTSWSFKPNDKYKSTHRLIHLLVDIVGKGGNLLLNVGPQPDGELPAEAVARLKEIGAWMKVNGEAIYGTRPIAPYKEGEVVFTRKGKAVYAIYLAKEEDGGLPPQLSFSSLRPAVGTKARLLGVKGVLNWQTDGSGKTTIEVPVSAQKEPPCRHAFVVKFELAGPGQSEAGSGRAEARSDPVRRLRPVEPRVLRDLFVWSDTCNVYVLRDGEAALLIDLGDGSVLDHLSEIGVKRVEWVLFTHHHREQCQGAPRLKDWGASVGAPEAEGPLFERPADFRKMRVSLGDAFSIHGSSYVRPPRQAIHLDRTFKPGSRFQWRGRELVCVDTPGNSPGAMTYLLEQEGLRVAFSGDVMLAGAKMHTWFDTEWDYGFGAGIRALEKSAGRLADYDPAWLLPAHGPAVRHPKVQLGDFGEKLRRLEKLYVRGYGVEGASAAYQDKVSTPTVVSNVWQVTPHLFKFKRPNFWPNFGLLLAESGRGLVVDCGLLDTKFLEQALGGMREHLGLKGIDAVMITHMHGDHFLQAPHLREQWGAQVWALDCMVDKMEHPERFDYAAPIQAYGQGLDGVRVDRVFKPGETFQWEGYRLTVDWMPGQTEFALCLHGRIDGREVAFTGDNIFGDPDDVTQTGHEAMVAHNSAILEEGYLYGAEYLHRLKPELLVGGHSFVMAHPAKFIERYRGWAYQMRDAFAALSPDKDYRYWFDPFWVRAEPYRLTLHGGQSTEAAVWVRNFRNRSQSHRIEIHTPPGIIAEPAVLEGKLKARSRQAFPLRLKAAAEAGAGVRIVALDATVDGKRLGEWFDLIVCLEP